MLAAIVGDVIGSGFHMMEVAARNTGQDLFQEGHGFTDDTVCSVAVADAFMNRKPYAATMREWFRRYPNRGYGKLFWGWANNPAAGPYDSYGNGGAMRVSPIACLIEDRDDMLAEAEAQSAITHNHAEGIRGALALAEAIWLAKQGETQQVILRIIGRKYGYSLIDTPKTMKDYMARYPYAHAETTVPVAIQIACMAKSFEDCMRLAAFVGGDTDTIASMAGAIAEWVHPIQPDIWHRVETMLPADILAVVSAFKLRVAD